MAAEYCIAYVTAENRKEAVYLAETIVKERLAACANILGTVTAVFHWEGGIEQGEETALLFKTRRDLLEDLTARVRELHSYDCPCVAALPIDGGNPAFLQWIGEETSKADS